MQSLDLNRFEQIGIGPDQSASFEVKEAGAAAGCDKNRKLHGRRSVDAATCSTGSELDISPPNSGTKGVFSTPDFSQTLRSGHGLTWGGDMCQASLLEPIGSIAPLLTLSNSSEEIRTFVQSAPLSNFFFPPSWSLMDV